MFVRWLLAFCCLLALAWSTLLADPIPTPPPVPVSLAVPANQTLALTLTAKGVQIYQWRPVAGDAAKFDWIFQAPEADLFDAQGRKVGRHSAGPTWELTGGGKVVGRVKAKADAPDGNGVPWLLLDAAQAGGDGIMGRVLSIRRINTAGGKAPPAETGPTATVAGQEARVSYTATYEFYVAKP